MKRNLTNLLKLKKENNKDKEIVWKYLQDLPFSLKDKKDAIELLFDQAQNQGGGDSSEQSPYKDVNFIDCDGTVLYAYTWDEWEKVNKLPPIPTEIRHTDNYGDVECRGWNWDLESINYHNRRYIGIGTGYFAFIQSGYFDGFGEVEFYGMIGSDGTTYPFMFTKKNAKIGDYAYGLDENNNIIYEGPILKIGRFDCKVDVGAIYGNNDFGNVNQIYEGVYIFDTMRENNTFRTKYIKIISYAFYLNEFLNNAERTITIDSLSYKHIDRLSLPLNTLFDDGALSNCNINDLNLNYTPYYLRCFKNSAFKNTKFIVNMGTLSILTGCFSNSNLTYIKFHGGCLNIGDLNMGAVSAILDFTDYTVVPTLVNITDTNVAFIIVPDNLHDEWARATNWANYTDLIISKSKYEDLINGRLEYVSVPN